LVELVFADDLSTAVRARLSGSEAASYSARRQAVEAVARVVHRGPHTSVVVATPILLGLEGANIDSTWIIAHEARHVAIHQYGESTSDGTGRLRMSVDYFTAVAGNVIEEYRVERALCDRGQLLTASYNARLAGVVERLTPVFDSVASVPESKGIPLVTSAFYQLATYLSYVIADVLASRGAHVPDAMGQPGWDRLVGSAWDMLTGSLAVVPSADVRWDRADADEAMRRLVAPHRDWLNRIGLQLHDGPFGRLSLRAA